MTQHDPNDQSQPTDLDRVKTLMTIYNSMSELDRAQLLRNANTAIPAEAMRYAGYDVPDKPSPSETNS